MSELLTDPLVIIILTAIIYAVDAYVTESPNPLDNILWRAAKKAWEDQKKDIEQNK